MPKNPPWHTKRPGPRGFTTFLSLVQFSLIHHIPSKGWHSSCSLPPISQTTPFLPSWNGSNDKLGPHKPPEQSSILTTPHCCFLALPFYRARTRRYLKMSDCLSPHPHTKVWAPLEQNSIIIKYITHICVNRHIHYVILYISVWTDRWRGGWMGR